MRHPGAPRLGAFGEAVHEQDGFWLAPWISEIVYGVKKLASVGAGKEGGHVIRPSHAIASPARARLLSRGKTPGSRRGTAPFLKSPVPGPLPPRRRAFLWRVACRPRQP